MTGDDWDRFEAALADTLAVLPERAVLIIKDREHRDRFAQYMHEGDHIWAEIATGVDEEGVENLTAAQRDRLAGAGWQAPGNRYENWGRRLNWPAPHAGYRSLARASVEALRDGYGVASPVIMEYQASILHTGQPLDLPGLGIGRADGQQDLPWARTNLEAHVYMDLNPCACGEVDFERRSAVVEVDGDLASRYTGTCPSCGRAREFLFRMPAEVPLPVPGQPRYGGDEPSRLIDPGEWLAVADAYARSAEVPEPGMDRRRRERSRAALARAAAALDEVLKFVPGGADAVPDSAFWTDRGRRIRDAEPGRFALARLAVVRDAYRRMLAELTGQP